MVQTQLAPAVKPLTFDRAAAVREAYYAALASWLGCHEDQQQGLQQQDAAAAHARCKTYAPALLPLLLLGVSDAQESIAAAALAAVEQVGASWQQQSAPIFPAAAAPGSQADAAATPMDTDDQQQQEQPAAAAIDSSNVSASAAAVAAAQLMPPFQGLPAAGCRRMVAELLPQLLPSILPGLREWTSSLRSAAARYACKGPLYLRQ
jgi:hypothetical protein